MTDQNVSLPPFGPLHSDGHETLQMLQQREVQLRRALHEIAALWDELAAAKHDAKLAYSLIAEMPHLQERIERLDAVNATLVEALELYVDCLPEDRCPDPNCGGECSLYARAVFALAQARRLSPDKESTK